MKIRSKLSAWAILSVVSGACLAQPHWSYEGKSSPEHWAELSQKWQLCHSGVSQSPIDIKEAIDGKLPPLNINFHTKSETIVNNGHTVQITVDDDNDFMLDNQVYRLRQFHFHTPSENTIDGKQFPLELHFVHDRKDGELAVVAVMLEEGEANPGVENILNSVPKKQGREQPLQESLDIKSLFPIDKHYYRFSGSLTTPPCSEGVVWLVMKQPITASARQIARFKAMLHNTNNRAIQPLHGRVIVE